MNDVRKRFELLAGIMRRLHVEALTPAARRELEVQRVVELDWLLQAITREVLHGTLTLDEVKAMATEAGLDLGGRRK